MTNDVVGKSMDWWMSCTGNSVESRCQVLDPNDSMSIWINEIPLVIIFHSNFNVKSYWEDVKDILEKFTVDFVPDPQSNFKDFVEFLFKNVLMLNPCSVQQCKLFAERTKYTLQPSVIIHTLPFICKRPDFYVEVLLNCKRSNSKLWKALIADECAVAGLFLLLCDAMKPTTNESKNIWEFRINVLELLAYIIDEIAGDVDRIYLLITKLIDKIMSMIENCPLFAEYNMVNIGFKALETFRRYTLKRDFQNKAIQFFRVLYPLDSFYFATEMNCSKKYHLIPNRNIINIICENGINRLSDIEFLMSKTDVYSAPLAISALIDKVNEDIVWIRVCMHAISVITEKYPSKMEAREILCNFIKGSFAFICTPTNIPLVKTKALILAEAISKLQLLDLRWVNSSIHNTLNLMKCMPNYMSLFFHKSDQCTLSKSISVSHIASYGDRTNMIRSNSCVYPQIGNEKLPNVIQKTSRRVSKAETPSSIEKRRAKCMTSNLTRRIIGPLTHLTPVRR